MYVTGVSDSVRGSLDITAYVSGTNYKGFTSFCLEVVSSISPEPAIESVAISVVL